MKNLRLISVIAIAVFTLLTGSTGLSAQDDAAQAKKPQHHHFKLVDFGFGSFLAGPPGRPLNNSGTLLFAACVNSDCSVVHTFTWRNGVITDLAGCLGPIWISDSALVAANALNGLIDPLTGMPEIRGFFCPKNGNVVDIGTLDGGYESFALAVNNLGSIAGVASNLTRDPFSLFGYPTETRAILWHNGVMRDLGTLGGPDAVGANINERAQVAGFSYTDSTPNATTGIPTLDPFLWENGKMIDIGTLGGTFGLVGSQDSGGIPLNSRGQVVGFSNLAGDLTFHPYLWDKSSNPPLTDLGTLGGDNGIATSINNAGEVVGVADLPGAAFPTGVHHGFLWRNGVMTDLGAFGFTSYAEGINSRRQIVGRSRTLTDPLQHAFLWENGNMIDLNILIPANSGLLLNDAAQINDRGEIAGVGLPPGCQSADQLCAHVFLLIPSGQDSTEVITPATQNDSAPATDNPTMSSQFRLRPNTEIAAWRSRLARRYHIPGLGAPKD
jgi:probable HAF family extracellular repeat protein